MEHWFREGFAQARYSQSLVRAFAILERFSPERPALGIAEIADPLGMSRSTAHRYVTTMVALGYLEQTSNRLYRLALRVIELGSSALGSVGLREQAESYLRDLRKSTGYTTSLAVLDGSEIVYTVRARSFKHDQRIIDHDVRVGSRSPAYCTAMGKVLLANLPSPVRDEVICEIELKRRGPHTITSRKALRTELDQVLKDGIATNDQELHRELVSIATGVQDGSSDVVASVSLVAHTSMISLEEMVNSLGPHLVTTADQISARMGFRRENKAKHGCRSQE